MSKDVDIAICVLVRQGYADIAERIAVLEASERSATFRANTTAQDRDNRRRRMDLAMVLLDESRPVNLDSVAAIVWPGENSLAGQSGIAEVFDAHLTAKGVPVTGDPTQTPTQTPTPALVDQQTLPPPGAHRHTFQVDSERRILSSFCSCGAFLADLPPIIPEGMVQEPDPPPLY